MNIVGEDCQSPDQDINPESYEDRTSLILATIRRLVREARYPILNWGRNLPLLPTANLHANPACGEKRDKVGRRLKPITHNLLLRSRIHGSLPPGHLHVTV
jgi:hypothetical protein